MTLNFPLPSFFHTKVSSSSQTFIAEKCSKKRVTSSSSQAWKDLLKCTSQHLPPPSCLPQRSATEVVGCNYEQRRKKILQLRIPNPNVPPKSCVSTVSNTDTSSKKEILPSFSNVFPKAHPIRIPHLSSGPAPFHLSKFSNNDFPPKISLSRGNLQSHFPSKSLIESPKK